MLCSFLLLFSSLTIFSLFPFCYFMSHNFILISPFHLPLQTCETEHFPQRKKSCIPVALLELHPHAHILMRNIYVTPTPRPHHAHATPISRPHHARATLSVSIINARGLCHSAPGPRLKVFASFIFLASVFALSLSYLFTRNYTCMHVHIY